MAPIVPGGLSGPARSVIRAVLYLEIVINTANGVVSIVSPRNALESLTTLDLANGQELALEVQRWFGAMGLQVRNNNPHPPSHPSPCLLGLSPTCPALHSVFGGFLLWRVLNKPAALRHVVEALLIGDVAYLGSLSPFAVRFGKLPLIVAPFALTLVMFVARAALLLFENWPNAEAEELRVPQAQAAAPAAGTIAATAPDAPRVAGSKESRRRSLSRVDRLLT